MTEIISCQCTTLVINIRMLLSLPTPDIKLIKTVDSLTSTLVNSESFTLNQQHHREAIDLNIAKCVYRTHPLLSRYVSNVYQPLFDESIHAVLINLLNTLPEKPAHYPPHTDKKRLTSLNFYIEPGGDNVTTTVYNEEGDLSLLGSMKNYNEVSTKETSQMNDQAWYLLDVNRYHSVENILTNRFIFCLSFADLTADSFKQKYKHLFI